MPLEWSTPTGLFGKREGLLSTQGNGIKHATQIQELLESVQKPTEIAIMHCKAHQTGGTIPELGNQLADRAAKEAAEKDILALIPKKEIILPDIPPRYDKKDINLIGKLKAKKQLNGWAVMPTGQVIIPSSLMREIAKKEQDEGHWGTENLVKHLQKTIMSRAMTEIVRSITGRCKTCLKNNPNTGNKLIFGVTKGGNSPGDYWQIDFTELPRKGGYQYILVLVDTFSGWPEAFPCRTNKAKEVVKILLQEIIPRFGIPLGMSSDNGSHFIGKIVKQLSKILSITSDYHTAYRPQSSGRVERMNYTLKQQLEKICQESSMTWVQALPLALLRIRIQPRRKGHLSPYELLYGQLQNS